MSLSSKSIYLDKVLLINMIRERPAIWDKYSKEYKLKIVREISWREICRVFKKDFDIMGEEEQSTYVRFIVQTWTRVREAWLKNLNERALRNPDCRPYKYDQHLEFLKKVVNIKDCDQIDQHTRRTRNVHRNESDSDESVTILTTDDGSECAETPHNSRKTRANSKVLKQNSDRDAPDSSETPNKRHKTHEISSFMIPDSVAFNTEASQDDRHLAFFKSIQPTVTKFDDDQFLDYQAGVIDIIRRIKNEQQYTDWNQHHTSTSASQYSLELKKSPVTETFY